MDWKCIANDDIQSQHIRCHQLQSGDKVQELVHSFRKAHSKALVLINTQNSYSLDSEFVEEIGGRHYPIIVVTKDDGAVLTQLIDSNLHQVEAKLDTVSVVDHSKEDEFDIIKHSDVSTYEAESCNQDLPSDQLSRFIVIEFTIIFICMLDETHHISC